MASKKIQFPARLQFGQKYRQTVLPVYLAASLSTHLTSRCISVARLSGPPFSRIFLTIPCYSLSLRSAFLVSDHRIMHNETRYYRDTHTFETRVLRANGTLCCMTRSPEGPITRPAQALGCPDLLPAEVLQQAITPQSRERNDT